LILGKRVIFFLLNRTNNLHILSVTD